MVALGIRVLAGKKMRELSEIMYGYILYLNMVWLHRCMHLSKFISAFRSGAAHVFKRDKIIIVNLSELNGC